MKLDYKAQSPIKNCYPSTQTTTLTQTSAGSTAKTNNIDIDTSAAGSSASTQPSIAAVTYNPVDFLKLPSNDGLFVVNQGNNRPYLVETNPLFTGYTNFIGSEYFLQQLGLTPETTTQRLGDAFFENRLIRDAVFNSTGQRYLANAATHVRFKSDREQMTYLMTNGIAQAQRMQLAYGIALSEDQVAALTHDMVWMVEQTVAGKKVLAPVF